MKTKSKPLKCVYCGKPASMVITRTNFFHTKKIEVGICKKHIPLYNAERTLDWVHEQTILILPILVTLGVLQSIKEKIKVKWE